MNTILSASKLKTLQECSWKFYCAYKLKLPQKTNDGARRGQCVHKLFECLLNPRHRPKYNAIVKQKTIKGLPLIERFVRLQMKKQGIETTNDHKGNHNFDLINQMILVGLLYDFYCEQGKLEKAETQFAFSNKEIGYSVRGIVDKISKHGDKLYIHDYKTSAKVFTGADLETNVQAMIYSLYAKRVRNMDSIVQFIFLRFPNNPIQELSFKEDVLIGFEHYLSYITEYIEKFDLESAKSNFAALKPYPKEKDGFKGPLLCGYSKYPGHTNKNGEEFWHCPFKWKFDYYALVDKETSKVKETAFNKKDLIIDKDHFIEKKFYAGCPMFN